MGNVYDLWSLQKTWGVLLDSELSFDAQINKVVSSCFNTIRSISRIKCFLNKDQLKTLVSTLVLSKLDYCNILYYGLNLQSLNKLQAVQNTAVRLVYKIRRYDRVSISGLCEKLHWLKVRERIIFKVLLIIHKCVINLAPSDITSMISFSSSDRTKKLEICPSNGSFGDRAFSVYGPKLWNALPLHMRLELSTYKFKKSLKTFLFTNSNSFYQVVNMK